MHSNNAKSDPAIAPTPNQPQHVEKMGVQRMIAGCRLHEALAWATSTEMIPSVVVPTCSVFTALVLVYMETLLPQTRHFSEGGLPRHQFKQLLMSLYRTNASQSNDLGALHVVTEDEATTRYQVVRFVHKQSAIPGGVKFVACL